MKKKFMKWKGFRILTAVCMALLLLLGVVPGVWASDTGSGAVGKSFYDTGCD